MRLPCLPRYFTCSKDSFHGKNSLIRTCYWSFVLRLKRNYTDKFWPQNHNPISTQTILKYFFLKERKRKTFLFHPSGPCWILFFFCASCSRDVNFDLIALQKNLCPTSFSLLSPTNVLNLRNNHFKNNAV